MVSLKVVLERAGLGTCIVAVWTLVGTLTWEEWVRVGHGVTTTRTPHTGVLLNLQTSPQDQEQTLTPHKAIEMTFPI